MTEHVTENTHCLACGGNNIHLALDLKAQPLANSYLDDPQTDETFYPLAVNLCHDCFHLQLSHTVDPAIIYKNYLYATGTNKTIQAYSEWFARFCRENISYWPSTVLDIGCNDGTQLNHFKALGFKTFGIDPAENLHERSSREHDVICDFFGPAAVERLSQQHYDIITAQNVCAHNPDPHGFLAACAQLMSNQTTLFVQTSQADMVLNQEFDTIYHEHVNFFNAYSMQRLAERVGLYLNDVVKSPIHGNSYIFILSKTPRNQARVANIIAMEAPLRQLSTYQVWRDTVELNMQALKQHISNFREQGYKIVGYGAAAKGNTLLNYAEIDLDFIVDDNELKQGLYTPGRAIPIVGISKVNKLADEDCRVVFVPLAWNFFTEIRERIQSARKNDQDVFLRYFPNVELVK
jgi:SAM-dependent methyltransferase